LRLDASNLAAVGRGCAMLGAGGGGDPRLSVLMAAWAVEQHGAPPLVSFDELAPDALVMPCGLVGAPTVADERIVSGDEGAELRDAVEALLGAPVAALMAYQLAGANGLLPVTWAARMGLPLADADGAGRAFPRLHQQAMHLAGVAAGPVVLSDGRGNSAVIRATDDAEADRLARATASSLGGVCAGALYCMRAREAPQATIGGSVTHARALGEAMARDSIEQELEAIGELGWTTLIAGNVLEVERQVDEGGLRSWAIVQARAHGARRLLRLELQNEFLLAMEDGAVRAVVPDLIAVLGADTGAPVPTEALRRGQAVIVVASPAPPLWTSEAGLALGGPTAFGYELEHVPIGSGPDVRA
jgi:DUF917 family protein